MAADVDLDLTLSQPELTGAARLDPRWRAALPSSPYAPDPRGARGAREVLASFLGARAPVHVQDLMLTASTSEAYAYLLLALCDEGDAILVPTPGYPLLEDIAQLVGVRLMKYALCYDGDWHVDTATLPHRRECERARVRFVLAVSPHNPTGHVLNRAEFAALSGLGVPIVVDEVFEPYVFIGRSDDVDPLLAGDNAPLTLVLNGLSKMAAAPGLKLGWICARGAEASEFLRELEYVSDAFLSVHQLVQDGLGAILEQVPCIGEQTRARLLENRALAGEVCADSALTPLLPRAGWSLILRLPHVREEADWVQACARAGARVQAGGAFGLPFRSSIVVSLLTEPSVFRRGLTRIRQVVDSAPGMSPRRDSKP